MNIQITLALRYLKGRKLRTVLTTLAVSFGVLVLFGMNIILPSMLQALHANEMGISGQVDVTITHVTGGAFPPSVYDTVKSIDGVSAAAPSLNRTINLPADFIDKDPTTPDRVIVLDLVGIDPVAERTVRAYPLLAGRFLDAADHAAAIISQSLADRLKVRLGDTFSLPTTQGLETLMIVGILPPRTSPGSEQILVTLPDAQTLSGQPGQINTIELNLNTTDNTRRHQIQAAIQSTVGSSYILGALPTGTDLFASLQLGQQVFSLFGVLSLFMGSFIIFNSFRTIVVERRRDIGMLRAIGADRKTITGVILVEGLLQGTVGTAGGLVSGYLLGASILSIVKPIMSQYVNLQMGNPTISPEIVVFSIILGVGVTVLAGLIPALNASKVTPLEALHPSVAEVEFQKTTGRGFILGVILIASSLLALFSTNTSLVAPGALLFLVGLVLVAPALIRPLANGIGWSIAHVFPRVVTGELAKSNLSRQPSRIAITASASMLGLAVIVAMGAMVSSMSIALSDVSRRNFGSDYLFMPPAIALWNSDMGANASFANSLRTIDGVGDVSTMRFAQTAVGGSSASLLGIDPINFPKVSGFNFVNSLYPSDAATYAALSSGRNLIANGAFIAMTQTKLGETLVLTTPSGTQSYKIIANATDLLNAKVTTAFISQANLAADFGKTEDVFIQLNLKPGANATAADKAIRAAAAAYPQFSITAGKAYFDAMMGEINAVFIGMYLLVVMLALPSLIATLNTLAIGVIERTRELGMVRAVGSTQKQVRRMVMTEALILAGIGTAFGLAAGLYLGYLVVLTFGVLFPMRFVFPTAGILIAILVGLGFGALAAIIPARQAARLQIVQALRYE